MNYRICIILISFFYFNLQAQIKKSALFIGNSYTYVNNLPQMVSDIALSKSDTLVIDQSTFGGYTFFDHCNTPSTWTKIRSKKWDYVILQAQSQEPSFNPSQVQTQTFPYAKQLADSIRKNNGCCEILFYMTWGRKNGDASNCPTYTPVCTYNGMQARLRESYILFKDSLIASVAPVGVAWKNLRTQVPLIDLYQADESHPNLWGTYLAACVFYSSIFQKSTIGSTYNPSIPTADLDSIQKISSKTVLDSTLTWNLESQLPKANFTYTNTGPLSIQFTNTSSNSNTFSWSFGNTTASPGYTFSGTGTFTVQLKSKNTCSSDSITKSVVIAGINEFKPVSNEIYVFKNNLYVKNAVNKNYSITLYDLSGKKISEYTTRQFPLKLNSIPEGIYMLTVDTEGVKKVIKVHIGQD